MTSMSEAEILQGMISGGGLLAGVSTEELLRMGSLDLTALPSLEGLPSFNADQPPAPATTADNDATPRTTVHTTGSPDRANLTTCDQYNDKDGIFESIPRVSVQNSAPQATRVNVVDVETHSNNVPLSGSHAPLVAHGGAGAFKAADDNIAPDAPELPNDANLPSMASFPIPCVPHHHDGSAPQGRGDDRAASHPRKKRPRYDAEPEAAHAPHGWPPGMDVHGQAAATWAPEYVGAADGAMMYSGGYLGPAAVVGAGGQGGLGHGYGPGMYCGPEMAGHGDPYGPRHASRPPPPAAPEHYADKAQARKARNRESAKRSRQKRQDEFDRLERENRALLERVQNMRSQLQWSFQAALAEAGRRAAGAGGEGGVCGRCRRAGGIRRTGSM